jgi:hypothetical protein
MQRGMTGNFFVMKGVKLLEKILRIRKVGGSFFVQLSGSQMEALATYYKCTKEEVPDKVDWWGALVFPEDGSDPFFAVRSQGDDED